MGLLGVPNGWEALTFRKTYLSESENRIKKSSSFRRYSSAKLLHVNFSIFFLFDDDVSW